MIKHLAKKILLPINIVFFLVIFSSFSSLTFGQPRGFGIPPVDNSGTTTTTANQQINTNNPQTNTPQATSEITGQSTDFPLQVKLENPLKVKTIQGAIKLFMDAVVKIAIPFIVVFFIWSGISFILAQGNATKITAAKNMFWYTVIGTLLILGAWAITDAIVGTINSIA